MQSSCDGAGSCKAGAPIACGFAKCTTSGPTATCTEACKSHDDCIASSLCDRGDAHQTGGGACLDPKRILSVSAGDLSGAINATSAAVDVIRIPAGTYSDALSISGKQLKLIGAGSDRSQVVIKRQSAGPAIVLLGGAQLQLQDLQVSSANGASGSVGHGIQCAGANTKLAVLDADVTLNEGVGVIADGCDVTLRRARISGNKGGGISLSGGGSRVVGNTLLVTNGTLGASGSAIGGAQLSLDGGTIVFTNNTVADNVAKTGVASGISCSGAITVHNSIVWGNIGAAFATCSFSASNVEASPLPAGPNNTNQTCSLDGSYRPATSSLCADGGDNAAPELSVLDHARAARVKGTVDVGAFEVK